MPVITPRTVKEDTEEAAKRAKKVYKQATKSGVSQPVALSMAAVELLRVTVIR